VSSETIETLIEAQVQGDEARVLKLFAARLFVRMPPELARRLLDEEALELARAGLDFFASRTDNPTLALREQRLGGQLHSVVQVAMRDGAFIVDSIRNYLHEVSLTPLALLHPVFGVARDGEGKLASFELASVRESREAYVAAVLEEKLDQVAANRLLAALAPRLREVAAATADFAPMSARCLQLCEELARARELIEVRDFLRWMAGGGWIFLGYRHYELDRDHQLNEQRDASLGILRAPVRELGGLEHYEREWLFTGPRVIVGKSRQPAFVHRTDLMDEILIRRGVNGAVSGFEHFLGLFTTKAASEEAAQVPLLRDKLRQLLQREQLQPGSHDYKELIAAFNGLPKAELFRASVDELGMQLTALRQGAGEDAVRVTIAPDAPRRMVIVMVLMPRERFSAQVRVEIQETLRRRLGGELIYYHLQLQEGYEAQLHFCFAAPPPPAAVLSEIRNDVGRLTRTWSDRLREGLIERWGDPRAALLAARYDHAFPPAYQAAADPARALTDIERLEILLAGGKPPVEISATEQAGALELRLYQLGEEPALSDLMPMLQNFGLRVLSEAAYQLAPRAGTQSERAFVLQFVVQTGAHDSAAGLERASELSAALSAVRAGWLEDDPLNALVVSGGLQWREVALLRLYLAAAFQMKLAPALAALRRIFLSHPALAKRLIEFFSLRLRPGAATPAAQIEACKADYLSSLGAIDNLSDDRSARRVLALVEATVRSNYFVTPAADTVPYLAIKLASNRLPDLPDVAPLYEIHVDSPLMQGCHLRAGMVARGGIRASDRLEDFRTEILELMKTQTVKNAIIVPVGAKGGFVLKHAGNVGPEQVVAAYKTLINGMLDLTDNVVKGRVIHPPDGAILDGDDPYLVVAADKGTAEFSDIANELAIARGFWLGDAFASGGSQGYDHKKLGITARGAWESAKRHLRELGRDPDGGAPVTVVGIGDMAGDVFGNGMLQSANLKLLAAFNHRHIFLDPDPDPRLSFAERQRLFALPHSQWSDYNPALLSPGGAIVRRGQKVIALSPQVRAALGIEESELDSDSLIKAILRAPVDLLYNGGIGTYLRASDESDAEVGDHANDGCRIAANQLRTKIVVEGGNLGFTQRARVEYALAGGRINTDAIDNSAGVDLSDHEVNLKILFAPALLRGSLDLAQRNQALTAATAEVCEQVLANNRDQVLLLSLEQVRSARQPSVFREHLNEIEHRGLLRRREEALPSHEALHERQTRFVGLTRPELAVLVAYTKIDLAQRLHQAAFIDDPYFNTRFLVPYFPGSIVRDYGAEVGRHQLRRELIATTLVNELVDLMGAIFIFSLMRDFDTSAQDAIRAWLIASDVLDLRAHLNRVKQRMNQLIPGAEVAALLSLEQAADRATRALLGAAASEQPIAQRVAQLAPAWNEVGMQFESALTGGERARFERYYRDLRAAGLAESDAHPLARLNFADHLLQIIGLSVQTATPASRAAQAFFALAGVIDFALIEEALAAIGPHDRWERRAAQDLALELQWGRLRLTQQLLAEPPLLVESSEQLGRWLAGRDRKRMEQVQHTLAELKATANLGLAPLGVAVRLISRLASAVAPQA